MNPWSRAESEEEKAERGDRALFARRAKVLEAPVLPSLESVLGAADEVAIAVPLPEARATRGARGRTLMAVALAAACMAAAVTRLPGTETRGSIVADRDAAAPRIARVQETASSETCTMDHEPPVSEEMACFTPLVAVGSSLGTTMGMTAGNPNMSSVPPTSDEMFSSARPASAASHAEMTSGPAWDPAGVSSQSCARP